MSGMLWERPQSGDWNQRYGCECYSPLLVTTVLPVPLFCIEQKLKQANFKYLTG
jgi:hypothetical protein